MQNWPSQIMCHLVNPAGCLINHIYHIPSCCLHDPLHSRQKHTLRCHGKLCCTCLINRTHVAKGRMDLKKCAKGFVNLAHRDAYDGNVYADAPKATDMFKYTHTVLVCECVCALLSTCVCLLKCLDAQFSMSVSEDGFLRVNSGKTPQLALGIMFLAFRLASNWAQAPRSSD